MNKDTQQQQAGNVAKDKYGNELRVGDAYDSSVDGEYLRCIGVVKSVDGEHIEGSEIWASPFRTTIELGCTRLAAEVAKLGEVGPRRVHTTEVVNLCTRCFTRIDEDDRHDGKCAFCARLTDAQVSDYMQRNRPAPMLIGTFSDGSPVTEPILRITEASASCAYADGSETFSDGAPVTEPSDWPEVTLDEIREK